MNINTKEVTDAATVDLKCSYSCQSAGVERARNDMEIDIEKITRNLE